MDDYIDQNITGFDLDLTNVCGGLYSPLADFDWTDTWFALNVQSMNKVNVPTKQFKNIVISFHTEYFDAFDLNNFFLKFLNCNFLLLHDGIPESKWPKNVTAVRWISWGQQLDVAIKLHSISDTVLPASKILSSLSNRHEFHKAAVTAWVQKNCQSSQYVLSWHNAKWGNLYYLEPGFFMPEKIKDYICNIDFQQQAPIKYDANFVNHPLNNGNWHHAAYEQCAVNLTNESVFNSSGMINQQSSPLSGPYLTEKTWKPLLAGRPFVPVGQKNTIACLENLGLKFDWGLDLGFDCNNGDFDRMLGIYECLQNLITKTPNEIIERSRVSCEHNLEWIRSGNFAKTCRQENQMQIEKIKNWQI